MCNLYNYWYNVGVARQKKSTYFFSYSKNSFHYFTCNFLKIAFSGLAETIKCIWEWLPSSCNCLHSSGRFWAQLMRNTGPVRLLNHFSKIFFHFLTNGYIFKGQGQSKKLTILSSLLARFTCQCFSRYSVCNPEEICLQRIDFRGHQFELYLAVKPCFCDIIPSNSQIGENIVRSRKTCNYTVLYCISFRKVNKIRYFFSYYLLPCLHCFHFWS